MLEYGVTTGFGEFKNVSISPDRLEELQSNLLLSHAAGAGETADSGNPANYFEPDVVRAVLFIRLNAFLKGHSNISERRTAMLLDSRQNRNLPANLIPHRGVNTGLMIVQYTAAGIVSENKVLTHPATVDSIPTSANSEDHNAMSTIAARKLRTVLRNAQTVLAIELLVAAQAVDWRVAMEIDPVKPRSRVLSDWEKADREAELFEERTRPAGREGIAAWLGEGSRRAYLAVRGEAETMLRDRMVEGDIRAVRGVVEGMKTV